MNKQELIKHFEGMEYVSVSQMGKKAFIDLIEQLDEPQKPVIPQFVADWYEKNKNNLDYNIWNYVYEWKDQEEDEFKNWFNHSNKAFQIIANMHQFGYEIEKEKRYLVKAKNIGDGWEYLKWNNVRQYWYFGNKKRLDDVRLYHTLENLKKGGFGNVFVNPLFTIEEVEG